MLSSETVRIGLLAREILPEEGRSDVTVVLMRLMRAIDLALEVDTLEREVPREIVFFRLFRRHSPTRPVMVLFEDAVNDAKLRRRIHEYCEQYGFFARTKYRCEAEQMSIRCDACKRYISDLKHSLDGSYVLCDCDIEYYPSGQATSARVEDEAKNTRWRKRYVSTGVMLIVDSRVHPTPAYKKFGLVKGENWRCKKPRRHA